MAKHTSNETILILDQAKNNLPPFSNVNSVQNGLRRLVEDYLFPNPKNPFLTGAGLFLLYRYFHVKCSDELFSLVPPDQKITARTCHYSPTQSDHLHFLCILIIRRKSHTVPPLQKLLLHKTLSHVDASVNAAFIS